MGGWAGGGPARVDVGGGQALWVFDAGLACCAVEHAAAVRRLRERAAGDETSAAGERGAAAGERGAGGGLNVLVVAGTVTDTLAPLVLAAYQRVPAPRRVLSFGACSNSGGPYWDSYCVTKGVDQIIPVDVYVPGCPPRPEALIRGLDLLAERG